MPCESPFRRRRRSARRARIDGRAWLHIERLLQISGGRKQETFAARRRDYLQSDWQPVAREAARNGDGRTAGHRDRISQHEPAEIRLEMVAVELLEVALRGVYRRAKHRWAYQQVVVVEEARDAPDQLAMRQLRGNHFLYGEAQT